TATPSRAVGVKRLDLVADAHGLAQILGAADNADAHLIRLAAMRGDLRPVQRVHADQVEAQFACGDAGQFQPLADDVERKAAARQRARASVGDLPFADETVDIADRDLQRAGAPGAPTTRDAHAIRRDLLDRYLRKIRDHVRLEIAGGIVHFVEQ